MPETEQTQHRWWDLFSAILLMLAMMTATGRLVATEWTTNLSITQTVIFFGSLAGFALGKSRFSVKSVFFFATVYGLFLISWQLGLTLENDLLWLERLSILLNRLGVIFFQIYRREAVQDALLFQLLMGILFWILSVQAAYVLVRHANAWAAVLPAGITTFIIHSFDPLEGRHAWYLAIYLLWALLLVARTSFLRQNHVWKKSHTALPPQLGIDIMRIILIGTTLIVLVAWTAPVLASALPAAEKAFQPVRQVWSKTRDNFENIFASLRANVVIVRDFYGNSVSLGRGNPLAETQVFSVKIPPDTPKEVHLYWRAKTYDTYKNGQWLNTIAVAEGFHPDFSDYNFPVETGRWLGTFEIVTAVRMSTLLTPPQPLWVNRPGMVELIRLPDDTVEVVSFRPSPSLVPGQSYQAQASIDYVTEADLRKAGHAYPQWVTEHYLQLPENITPRTIQLAERITAGIDNPYDQAVAITRYLRGNMTYVDSIDEEFPSDQELIDWFLFDIRKGFCNYYSTAEVLLLRSVGIPARWAVGYAQGERLEEYINPNAAGVDYGGTYIVRQRDSHAWVEVYFPGIGWVEFEPTASQPFIDRPSGEDALVDDTGANTNSDDRLRQQREWEEEMDLLRRERETLQTETPTQETNNLIPWLFIAAAVVVLYLVGRRIRPRFNLQATPILLEEAFTRMGIKTPKIVHQWAKHARLAPIVKAYQEINLALKRLGHPPKPESTPAERATTLAELLPDSSVYARQLVREYYLDLFSNKREYVNPAIALVAATEIRKLSRIAYARQVLSKLRFVRQPST